jgi:copper transport protein
VTLKEGMILLLRGAKWGLAGLAVVATLALAPAAWAHSTLESTEPARDGIVEHSPERVLLRFDEPVETALGSIVVYDGEGERVDAGEVLRPRPDEVAVRIDGELASGTYTVAWRVISADSDPIKGAWVFHVGEPGAQPEGIAAQVLNDTPLVTSVFYLAGRAIDFALILACVGGVAALAFALRSASQRVRRRLFGVVAGLAAALALVSLVEMGLQAAAAEGTSLSEGFRWEAISSVTDTRFGQWALIRAGLAAALCVFALVARAQCSRPEEPRPAEPTRFGHSGSATNGPAGGGDGGAVVPAGAGSSATTAVSSATVVRAERPAPARATPWTVPVLLALAAGVVFTPGLSGHASVIGVGSVIADAAHVQAAAVWTGGLAFLVMGLVWTRSGRWELAATSVPRFSTTAVVSVAILIIAGTINGYLQVRAWRGLWETEYGILLLVKVGLVLPLLAMGAYNNRFAVPRLRAQIASRMERVRFLRFAGAELAVMLAVVGVTAALVNAAPARTEIEMDEMSEMEVDLGPFMAHMEITPGTVGPNQIHLDFERGRPEEVNVSARLEERDIGPLRYRARRGMEPGAYVVRRANLAPAGEWELRIDARRGEFDLYSDTVHVSLGGAMSE